VVTPDLACENFHEVACRLSILAKGDEMRHFCEAVDNDPQLVAFLRKWQVRNKVHGDRLPWRERKFKGVQHAGWAVASCLVFLTVGTAPHEINNLGLHLWPPEIPSDDLNRLILSHMSGDLAVVLGLEYRFNNIGIVGHP